MKAYVVIENTGAGWIPGNQVYAAKYDAEFASGYRKTAVICPVELPDDTEQRKADEVTAELTQVFNSL